MSAALVVIFAGDALFTSQPIMERACKGIAAVLVIVSLVITVSRTRKVPASSTDRTPS